MRVKKEKGLIYVNLNYGVWKQQLCRSLYNLYFTLLQTHFINPVLLSPRDAHPQEKAVPPPVSPLECAPREVT